MSRLNITNVIRVKRREIQTLHCSKLFIFLTPTQPRISFERAIFTGNIYLRQIIELNNLCNSFIKSNTLHRASTIIDKKKLAHCKFTVTTIFVLFIRETNFTTTIHYKVELPLET
jgi:hypothetical protein